ncbi:PE family protein [Mycobacterium parmense]|uniref:PE family protein PE12 n=1 Tax=Mycobacterium parmense TaxID=185642 RepID=A0A7I7YLZ1_9MYCO|nr:PE family protein [Mycobacterium parmense]MCV7349262.1 PE family protein [Mycobacterium parmense]ORW57362.1 PE family protein [Mycobacterium parmense]BBZ42856.1 PE family protein PE12 [Mycobacterium parmense]
MSFVLAAPEALVTAAADLSGIGSALTTAHAAAAASTTGLAAAAGDEVSTQIAALFSTHARAYQQLSTQVAAFHEQFVQVLSAGANTYAATESNAVQTLVNTVRTPAQALLGHPLAGGTLGGAVSGALSRVENAVLGGGAAGLLGTGGPGLFGAIAGRAGALLGPAAATAAAAAPAANALAPLGQAIENAYLAIEPWVQYGFELLTWAAGWVIGPLAAQIMFFYNLFEPIVQSVLFNAIDFIDGTVSFAQGLSNISAATTASINQFITAEIYWIRGFFPPLPPIGSIAL